jgi:hydroxysqualene dehydroxylase
VKPHVAIVGAGWSGLAAAVTLLDAGAAVTLLDAAPQVGGRARQVDLQLGDRTYGLDNGQHLLIGAYREYLALARRVGISLQRHFLVTPFALHYPDGFRLVAARLPAPLHLASALLSARGLRPAEKVAAAAWVRRWQHRQWTLGSDVAAASLFEGHPALLVERLWAPLCLAALNVRLEHASARIFLRVLGDSLGATAGASRLLVPRGSLSTLFPDAARIAIASAGGALRLRSPVQALERSGGNWLVHSRKGSVAATAVILALPPARSAELLGSLGDPGLGTAIQLLRAIDSAPISTVYLRYAATTRLQRPVFALVEQPATGDFGQWVFDRGRLEAACAGVLSVVVSGAGPHGDLAPPDLARSIAAQLSRCLGLPTPESHAVIVEKRATVVAGPGLVRPPARLPVPRLYLAGDAADSPYPSTLEGSIRSGIGAARAALAEAVA